MFLGLDFLILEGRLAGDLDFLLFAWLELFKFISEVFGISIYQFAFAVLYQEIHGSGPVPFTLSPRMGSDSNNSKPV